jgi:hypothetical protein
MSKTYLYCLFAIALYLIVIKPINKDKLEVKEDEQIISDFEPGGANGNPNDWTMASHKEQTVNKPTYTI